MPDPGRLLEAGGLVSPAYEEYCLVNVPGSLAARLGVDVGPSLPGDAVVDLGADVSHVALVLVDGLGYRRWRRDALDYRLFARLEAVGHVTPLTTVVPSSTPTAVTSVHTAAAPAEHGILGWDVRLPAHEAIVEAFPHALRDGADDPPPVAAETLVAAEPVYPSLEAAGVRTRVVQPAATLGTAYAGAAFRGAEQVPANGRPARCLRRILERATGPTYTYVYLPRIDALSHEHGTDAPPYHRALAATSERFAAELYDRLDSGVAAETLLAVVADHGMIDLPPGAAGCLDLRSIDGLDGTFRRRSTGTPVPPYGDPRATHLAVRPEAVDDALDALAARGVPALTATAARDLFGPEPGPAFTARCGDVVCFPPVRKIVHAAVDGVVPYVGMHGGRTPTEMLVPFATGWLSTLQG